MTPQHFQLSDEIASPAFVYRVSMILGSRSLHAYFDNASDFSTTFYIVIHPYLKVIQIQLPITCYVAHTFLTTTFATCEFNSLLGGVFRNCPVGRTVFLSSANPRKKRCTRTIGTRVKESACRFGETLVSGAVLQCQWP